MTVKSFIVQAPVYSTELTMAVKSFYSAGSCKEQV